MRRTSCATHLGLELGGIEPHLTQDAQVPISREASVFLELAHLLDPRAQLVVRHPDALALGPLHDHGLRDQLADHLLVEAKPLGQLRRHALLGHAFVRLDHVGLGAPEALGGDLLAVHGRDHVGLGAPATDGTRAEVDDRRADEGHDDDDEHDLQTPEVLPHAADHGYDLPRKNLAWVPAALLA